MRATLRELREKGGRYWLTVLLLLVAGVWVGHWLGEQNLWIELRYRIYPAFQALTPEDEYPRRTALVVIDDDDYWKGELAGRSPLKRDYLARLVRALDAADPRVIALDIDLRSPLPREGTEELPEYRAETEELLAAIKDVSHRRPVVLASFLADEEGGYALAPSVYDRYDFAGGRVLKGFTALPRDLRQVAVYAGLKGGARADSFAAAVVRPLDERALGHEGGEGELPYGTYYHTKDFPRRSARQIIQGDPAALKEELGDKIILVGGGWHQSFYRGEESGGEGDEDRVDRYFTPVGYIQGVYIHANYVEALLNHRVRKPLWGGVAALIDVLCSVIMAVIFALELPIRSKLVRVLVLCLLLVVLSYFLWQNLGFFFDFFIPVVLLGAHALLEEWRESRAEVRHLRSKLQELEGA
jgi:CHASE2 domain-containing sensor protein